MKAATNLKLSKPITPSGSRTQTLKASNRVIQPIAESHGKMT